MEELGKLKIEYEKIRQEWKNVHEKVETLKQEPTVKKYLELQESQSTLVKECNKLYEEIKSKEFASCNHVWIVTSIDSDPHEGRSYRNYGCIKCGLSEDIRNRYDYQIRHRERELIPLEHRIICDFLEEHGEVIFYGPHLNLKCNLYLAKAVYLKLKQIYPELDDKTLIKYLEKALIDISEIEVSEERKISRAKRLSLNPEFKNWKTITLRH